jgi:hypothetical protein
VGEGRRYLNPTFWLEIAVNESHKMKVLQSGDDFRGVKSRAVFWKALAWPSLERSEKLAAHAVLHAKIKILFGLK